MDTRKFEYLETIRETIEQGDYEELKDYITDIHEAVKNDPDFEEIFMEVNSGKYSEVVLLIDDIIYREMQAEFDELDDDDKPSTPDLNEFSLEFDFDEDLKEEISFEPFDDEGYFEKSEDE